MTILLSALFILFLAFSLVQLAFWLGPAAGLLPLKRKKFAPDSERVPVSLVVCARNALDQLKRAVPIWLAQDYPEFELIVVDDGSVDGSADWLRKAQADHDRLRVLEAEQPSPPGKKAALTKGIQAARYPLVLLTDADCLPLSRFWIQHMQAELRGSTEIGLGLSVYRRYPGWLNRFIRFDALNTGMQYLALAHAGMPYMGVGRNLIYARELFNRVDGMRSHQHIISGDDDLFVNQAASYYNTRVILRPESLTLSEPKGTWRGFLRQKKRHLSVGREYKPFHKAVLAALSLSWVGHYAFGLILLLAGAHIGWVVALYALRMVAVNWVSSRLWPDWRSADLLPWIPVLDLAYAVYLVRMAPTVFWGKVDAW